MTTGISRRVDNLEAIAVAMAISTDCPTCTSAETRWRVLWPGDPPPPEACSDCGRRLEAKRVVWTVEWPL